VTILRLQSLSLTGIKTHLHIQKSKGLQDLFTEIVTNPAEWDPSGLLKVRRHVDPDGPQHNCPRGCNENICKGDFQATYLSTCIQCPAAVPAGQELKAFLKRQGDYDRIIYVGDGSNDFCPIVELRRYRPSYLKAETTTTLLLGRIWYFAADSGVWRIASSMRAKENVFCVKSGIGQVHGKSRNFSGNSPMRL
jgi:hypothetical protein